MHKEYRLIHGPVDLGERPGGACRRFALALVSLENIADRRLNTEFSF